MKYLKLLMILCLCACHASKTLHAPFPFLGFALDGFPVTKKMINRLQDETQLSPAIVVFYLQWPAAITDYQKSIQSSLNTIWNKNAVPSLTWEPMVNDSHVEKAVSYHDILNGTYDPYLEWMASEIKAWGKPIIIRFAQEMNLSRYHWGTSKEDYNSFSPAIYRAMFQYVVTFFRKRQVSNVLWAFSPNAESVPKEDWNTAKNYYPGDDYVDILGMDGYNWDISPELAVIKGQNWSKPWHSFKQIFENIYQELKQIAPNKPFIVFETASVDRSNSGKTISWLKDALQVAKQWEILAIVWFQVDKEEKWKLHQDVNSLTDNQPACFQNWLLEKVNDFK